MSKIEVDTIDTQSTSTALQIGDTNTATIGLGKSGDTITIPSGATISNLGTATGFGGTGVVSWDTASIKTTGFTAVTGTGYFCNTTGGAFTVTLPLSPSAGDVIGVADYAKTFDTDNLTLGRNGSNIGGGADDASIQTEGIAVTLVYVDATKGWIVTDSGNQSDAPLPTYIAATGGCITTCGNFKMHTFLSPNTFCVSAVGNPAGSNTVEYMVVAGGGGGGSYYAGGGGAGGYRESPGTASGSYTVSPLGVAPAVALPVSVTGYPITVGGGGTSGSPSSRPGGTGVNSVFSTITSAGGGGGGSDPGLPNHSGNPGGSGGGSAYFTTGDGTTAGTGNTPPVTPPQGNTGGLGTNPGVGGHGAGGGGGATAVGQNAPNCATAGAGGAGATSSINTTPTARAGGGGGGGGGGPQPYTPGAGGAGGGGAGATDPSGAGTAGTVNTGGGGGGGNNTGPAVGGTGGSGIVIIRYKFQ